MIAYPIELQIVEEEYPAEEVDEMLEESREQEALRRGDA